MLEKIYIHVKNHIYAKFYPCFVIQMVSSHIYKFFVCQNLSMCHTYIHYVGPTPKSVEYQFFGQFLKFPELSRQLSPDMSGLWPIHIWLAGHVRLWTRTCLAPGPDIFGSPVYSLYKGIERRLRTLGLFSLPLHLLRRPRAL
jgi:hypothetical protein